MRTLTYYLPDELDSPLPPEGFAIIGYRTLQKEQIDIAETESYLCHYVSACLRGVV